MADPITPIVQAVTPYLVEPIKRELGYLFDYRSNVEDLIKKLEELGFLIGRVEQSIQAATNNAYDIQPELKTWQNSVNEIIKKAGKLFDDEEKEKKRCFNRLRCNLKSRYQLSKKAKKTAAAILLTIQAGEKFDKSDNVSYPVPPQGTGSTSIKGYEAFESRMSTLNEVMEALKDTIMSMIGVFGMGGVGKTMLVTELARKVKEDKLFDQVVMAVVSQTPNVRKIQEDIAYPLGLIFDDMEINSQRKDRLCRRLKNEKSILVILDDIWEKLDLETVGIPSGDDHKGCKIVMTSRNQDTLSDDMGAQKNFLVNVLSDPEAWNLFKKITGDIVEAHELKPTAIEIAQECAGLPIAIAAVANALKNKSLPIWKDALRQLKSSTPTNIKGMHTKVYSTLELSYNFLQSEEQKSLFLLCSLLPEDYTFSTLDFLKFGKGLGLFQDISTLEESRDRVHTLVYQLKSSCLLLESDNPKLVKMHDVIRDVGISVASKDKHMLLVRNEVELEQCSTEGRFRNCPAISLPYSKIHELPPGLKCPELKLLLLLSNDRSLTIPDTFFEGMKQLKVLDLTNICFSTLPSSLNFLSNLQTLCLDKCELRDIASIGELKKLEVLSFASSDIEELPREIGELTRLKLLDLSDCYKLKVIPSNVIASLSQLEDLYMKSSFVEWEIDGNVSLAELKHLSHLVTLDIHIQDANILPKDLRFEKLMRYRIFVGDVWDWYGVYETSRTLKLKLNTSIQQFGINMLLERAEDLYLDELNGLKSILYSLNEEGFPHLKHLHVQKSCEIEYIINTMERVPNRAFPNLESLFLYNLINLKEICHGQLPVESFCNLRRVEVQYCASFKDLFSLSMARSLLQLQELKIDECQSMDEIVAEGGEGSEGNNEAMNEIVFPQLRSLTLRFLPMLMSFYSKGKTRLFLNYTPTIDVGSEEISSEGEHDIPIPLFNEKVAFPNLEELDLVYLNSMKEIWQGQFHAKSFCRLKVLNVGGCEKILKVFPISLLQNLQNLEKLTVGECSSLEVLFELGGVSGEVRHAATLPQLRELTLINLSKLMHLWEEDSPQLSPVFQNLTTLSVISCGSLTHLLLSTMAKSLVQIKSIKVEGCVMMEEIIASEEGEVGNETTFSRLNSLNLRFLPNLKIFHPGSNTLSFPSLQEVLVVDCSKLKTFSNGILNTPELENVQIQKLLSSRPLKVLNKGVWKGDLNSTIQHLFAHKEDLENLN